MAHFDWTVIVGHLLLFASTVIGFLFQWYREKRNHRWQKEELKNIQRSIDNGYHTGK